MLGGNQYGAVLSDEEPLLKSWEQRKPTPVNKYQDVWALVLFLINVGVVCWLSFDYGADAMGGDTSVESSKSTNRLILLCVILAGVGGLISGIALWAMMHYASFIILSTIWAGVIFNIIAAIMFAVAGVIWAAILFIIVAMLNYCWLYLVRSRIPFASANLKVGCSAVSDHVGVVGIAVVFVTVQLAWCFLWTLAMVGLDHEFGDNWAQDRDDDGNDVASPGQGMAYFGLLVSFYWGFMVIKNIVHVTVCGAVGSWWFQQYPVSPVAGSLRRAVTSSLGSICLGSLLVAFIKALRQVVDTMRRDDDSCLTAVAACFLQCLDSLLSYFNRWAYTYVALYGMSFTTSGRAVMDLFRARGWTVVVNDSLIDNVLSYGAFIVGALTAGVGAVCGEYLKDDYLADVDNAVALLSVIGLVAGMAMALVMMSVVDSAVATVFVCFAEDSEALQLTHPQHHEDLVHSWQLFHPDCLLRTTDVV